MRKIAFGRDEGWSHSAVTRRVKRQRSLDSGISVSLRSLLINRADYESATVTSRDITVTARDEGVHGLVVTNSSSRWEQGTDAVPYSRKWDCYWAFIWLLLWCIFNASPDAELISAQGTCWCHFPCTVFLHDSRSRSTGNCKAFSDFQLKHMCVVLARRDRLPSR
jgi:hypothetical protein